MTQAELKEGVLWLIARDADLARIHYQFGMPPLWSREPGFATLIFIILEQQVSLASARAAFERLQQLAMPLTPQTFLSLENDALRAAGFSRQKTRYGRLLAEAVQAGDLELGCLPELGDDAARAQLVHIKGIGPWTADIYLLMALGRPDIWPAGDLALAVSLQRLKGLPRRPSPAESLRYAESWRPWRAVAARLLWHDYLCRRDA
ncbi:MAG TPA: hypothetical protein VF171_00305 [Trueperaceae bacterium]